MAARVDSRIVPELAREDSDTSSIVSGVQSFTENPLFMKFGDGSRESRTESETAMKGESSRREMWFPAELTKASRRDPSMEYDATPGGNDGIKTFAVGKEPPHAMLTPKSDVTSEDEEYVVDEGPLEVSIVHGRTSTQLRNMMHFVVELLKPTSAKIAPRPAKVSPKDARNQKAISLEGRERNGLARPANSARVLKRTPSAPLPSLDSPDILPERAPFGDVRDPKRPPLGAGTSGEDTAESTTSERSLSGEESATARPDVEVDVESGDERLASVMSQAETVAAVTVAAPATTAVTQVESEDSLLILPCAPSDDEKVMYHKSGRLLLISCGLIAFYTMSVGMWLFTITSPYFFWFGVPTVFLMFYLICHYLLVALWGIDFNPEEHAEIVRRAREGSYWPTVDVFLPVCKEPLVLLSNTWKHIAELDYPSFTVHVLDDGAQDEVRDLAAEFGFQYVRRSDRPHLKKAGNLRYSFMRTTGEAIAIFDADFCPRKDYLRETVPYLFESSVGILQTPQFFRWRKKQTWVEQGAGVTQEFFYRMVQVNQDRFSAAVCCGSCGLYRRAALEPFGGMAAIAHSEDMYTGFKITTLGYKIKYLPLNLAMGTCPADAQSFFMQQYRWCMGSATLVAEKDFWESSIPVLHKVCFLNGMLYYVASALLVFVAPMPILLLIAVEADGVLWYHSGFAVPAIIVAGIIVPCWAKQRYGLAGHRIKILQCYAHLFAIYDRMWGRSAPWVPSGGGASKASSKAYRSSVWVMVSWNILITFLIVGGAIWRMTYLTWYHFVPAIVLALGSFYLNMSTLCH